MAMEVGIGGYEEKTGRLRKISGDEEQNTYTKTFGNSNETVVGQDE